MVCPNEKATAAYGEHKVGTVCVASKHRGQKE